MRRPRPLPVTVIVAALGALCWAGLFAGADAAEDRIPPDQAPEAGRELLRLDWDRLTPPEPGSRRGQILRLNLAVDPVTFDPHAASGVAEARVLRAIYEGLTVPHPRTLRPLPGVAEWWEISEDRLLYTFHLRASAVWSDGNPVTAGDFVWSWNRAVGQRDHQYRFLLEDVGGYQAASEGRGSLQIGAPDSRTFRVKLRRPAPWFLTVLSQPITFPVHRPTVEAGEAPFEPGRAITNGPFELVQQEVPGLLRGLANPRYWAADRVRLAQVDWLSVMEEIASVRAFDEGRVDWIGALPADLTRALSDRPEYFSEPYGGTYYVRINARPRAHPGQAERVHPLSDWRVRRAINLAIDRAGLCTKIATGPTPASGFVPPGMDGYRQYDTLATDVEAARALLAEAGYPKGAGMPRLRYVHNASPTHAQVAQILRAQLQQTLGIGVDVQELDWAQYLEHVQSGRYDLARSGWIGDFPCPHSFLHLFETDDPNGSTGWSDAQYDRLLDEARGSSSGAERARLWRDAETRLFEQGGPVVPLYYYVAQGLKRARVRGWHPNLNDEHPLRFVWIAPE